MLKRSWLQVNDVLFCSACSCM